jgi:hypothetical protein
LPTNYSIPTGKEEICIEAGITFWGQGQKQFGYQRKAFYEKEKYKLLDFQQFCKIQNISSEKITELNKWFEINKSNRTSNSKLTF